jgi:hypothetical protein
MPARRYHKKIKAKEEKRLKDLLNKVGKMSRGEEEILKHRLCDGCGKKFEADELLDVPEGERVAHYCEDCHNRIFLSR